jgi:hypothetical protein
VKRHLFSQGIIWALLSISQAYAAECETDRIKIVSMQGAEIVMASGRNFEIAGQDFIDVTEWRPGEQVSLCLDTGPNSLNFPALRFYNITHVRRRETVVGELKESPAAKH